MAYYRDSGHGHTKKLYETPKRSEGEGKGTSETKSEEMFRAEKEEADPWDSSLRSLLRQERSGDTPSSLLMVRWSNFDC